MNIEPCIWCEGKVRVSVGTYPKKYVICESCGATSPIKSTEKEAIEAWNEVARIVREAKENHEKL